MDPETLTEDEKKSDEALSVKTKELMVRNKKRMAEREQYRKVLSSDYHSLFRFFPPTSKSLSFSCFFFKTISPSPKQQKTWHSSWMFFVAMQQTRHIHLPRGGLLVEAQA